MRSLPVPVLPFVALLLAACGSRVTPRTTTAPVAVAPAAEASDHAPVLPPREAFARGWMPLASTGVDQFRAAHPTYDGRGVLIAVLDGGVDPGIPGLGTTSTGDRKILDLRDFSGEGAVTLSRVTPDGDRVTIGGALLAGISRVRALAVGTEFWGGSIAEIPLGELPASDLNGDRDDNDTFPLLVIKASDGWVVFADTDGDGSLANEKPIHDYLIGRESFGWHTGNRLPPLNVAVNLREEKGAPRLDLYFDTSAHGSHVSGIAAGHNLYDVEGFDGVAPGAMLIGLKIANNAQGGLSTTGSMLSAVDYAIRFAAQRSLPLVLNMSFGVGNETEGKARIDAMFDSVLALHPELIFTISASNDGPGLSTLGFPGSASRVLTIGATFPGVFLGAPAGGHDPVAYFSSRGGELAKPDLVTPGMAYSTVPRWNVGDERKGGTSMAAPYAAGLSARLISGLVQLGRKVEARQIRQALMVTARPVGGETYLDDGTGVADINAAWRWLEANRTIPEVAIRPRGNGVTAAFRTHGLAGAGDTLQLFDVVLPAGSSSLDVTLRSSAAWLTAPASARMTAGPNAVLLRYDRSALLRPGVYSAVVTGWTADSLLGPVFRLVNTVVVPDTGSRIVADLGSLAPGAVGRLFFEAETDRPFAVAYGTRRPGQQILAYLHEPGGQPYREDNGIGAGYGDQNGLYLVDGRDVVPGQYEAVAVAPPLDGADAVIAVQQSPLRIQAGRDAAGIGVELTNLSADQVTADPFVVLVGAERTRTVAAKGSEEPRLQFELPEWAIHATVDVSMPRAQWNAFTDFGVTVVDQDGRILGKGPLNYAFGRLHLDLPRREAPSRGPLAVVLFPGLAEARSQRDWSVDVSIRLYTDSAHVTQLPGDAITLAPGARGTARVPFTDPRLPGGDGFVPLGIVVVAESDRTWTRETPLAPPSLSSNR